MTGEIKHWAEHDLKQWDGLEPIILMMHGYGSQEHDLTSIPKLLPGDLPWVSLRGPVSTQHGGHAWFNVTTPGNPSAENVEPATEAIWRWIDAHLPSSAPIIALGFSQGGLMASQLLRTRPERILGTVILAGFTLGAEQPADAKLAKAKPSVIYCRGLDDRVIPNDALERTMEWLGSHSEALTPTYEGLAHSIDQRVVSDVANYVRGLL